MDYCNLHRKRSSLYSDKGTWFNETEQILLDEVAFSSFIPLPGSKLYDQLVKEGKSNADWTSLISIDDLSEIVLWSEYIPSKRLRDLKRKVFLEFI